jgi:tetratricopeptide (TPR) repeat protein
VEYLQGLFDWLLAAIAWLFVWQPGAWIKNAVQLFVAVGGAVSILYKTVQWLRGERAATRKDIRSLKDEAATKGDIENLKAELRAELRSRDTPGRPMASDISAGLEKDLDKAVETLLAAGRADALKDKTGEAAEAALDELIAQRQAARERVSRDEAGLYRQKGALAFLHDTEKAVRAYAKATELDPDDPDGWNQLGELQVRIGELDTATCSFERVLALGNRIDDQGLIAVATGNLGVIYRTRGDIDRAETMFRKSLALDEALGHKEGMAATYGNLGLIYRMRGDLDQAEAMHRKSLAIEEALGRKEGMAADYGNLGTLFAQKGNMAQACVHWRKARDLFAQIGAKPQMEQAEGLLRKANCPEA